jgi:PAS domain S-box-containing protein
MLDGNGNVMSWNRGAEHINRYKASEIIGKHISVFYTEDEIQKGIPGQNLQLVRDPWENWK